MTSISHKLMPVVCLVRLKLPLHTEDVCNTDVDPLDVPDDVVIKEEEGSSNDNDDNSDVSDDGNDDDNDANLSSEDDNSTDDTNVKCKLRSRAIKESDNNHHLKGASNNMNTIKQEVDALEKSPRSNFGRIHKNTNNKLHSFSENTIELPFQCTLCTRRFSTKSLMICHRYIHTAKLPYKCDVCGKILDKKANIPNHMYLHIGAKFKCDMCDKIFSNKDSFKLHMFVHYDHTDISNDKIYQCDICRKLFPSKGFIKSHMKTHDGFRPLKCTMCGKGFSKRCQFEAHLRRHTGEPNPHKCDICDKSYNYIKHLIAHKETHRTLFKCELCLVGFYRRKLYLLHWKNEHSDEYI